jgi:hypothetical protein
VQIIQPSGNAAGTFGLDGKSGTDKATVSALAERSVPGARFTGSGVGPRKAVAFGIS